MQEETIELSFNDAKALLAIRRTNDGLEKLEQKAGLAPGKLGRVADSIGEIMQRSVDKQTQAIERSLTALEKRVASPIEILKKEHQEYINMVDGDASKIERVNKVFQQLQAEQTKTALTSRGVADAIAHPLQAATGAVDGLLAKFGMIGAVAGGAALGIGLVAKQAYEFITTVADASKQTVNLADRLGVTVQEAKLLEGQARISGVGVDSLSGLIRKLSTTLTEGGDASRTAVRQFDKLGIAVLDSQGNFRDSVSLMRDLSEHLDEVGDHAHQIAFMAEIFGKGAVELFPLIKNFGEAEAKAKDAGAALHADIVEELAKVKNEIEEVKIAWGNLELLGAKALVLTVQVEKKGFEFLSPSVIGDPSVTGVATAVGSTLGSAAGRYYAGFLGGDTSALPAPITPEPKKDILLTPDQRRANDLVDKFRNGDGLDALKKKLTDVEAEMQKLDATIQHGAKEDIVSGRITQLKQLAATEKGLQEEIKAIEDAPGEAKKAAEEQARIAQTRADGIRAAYEILAEVRASEGTEIDKITLKYYKLANSQSYEAARIRILAQAEREQLELLAQNTSQKGQDEIFAQQQAAQPDITLAGYQLNVESRKSAVAQEAQNKQAQNEQDQLALKESHDAQMRNVEAIGAATIQQKIFVEQRKVEIELEYLQKSLKLEQDLLDLKEKAEVAASLQTKEDIDRINKKYEIESATLKIKNDAAVASAQESAAIKTNEIVQEQNQKTFDHFKTEAEHTIDAFTKIWTKGWAGMADVLKSVLLTPLKELASSQIARLLYQAAGGGSVGFSQGASGGSGLLGQLAGGLGLGSIPLFGAGGFTGGPGGTAPFAGTPSPAPQLAVPQLDPFKIPGLVGPASTIAKGSPPSPPPGSDAAADILLRKTHPELFGLGAAGLASTLAPLALGGSLLGGLGAFKLGQSHSALGKSLAIPTGVAAGLLGFGALSALFPALILAGPAGWIAAGAIGGLAGLIGLFKTSAEDKIVKKVEQIYGFKIDRSFAKNSLLPIIKQQFGGDIDTGLRSPQVRDLIELYAMSKGLNTQGIVARATPSVFASQGSSSFVQVPTYQNGVPVLAGSSQSVSSAVPATVQVQNLVLQMPDGQSMNALLDGRIVSQPRTISRAADQGQLQRGSRQGLASSLVPNFIV